MSDGGKMVRCSRQSRHLAVAPEARNPAHLDGVGTYCSFGVPRLETDFAKQIPPGDGDRLLRLNDVYRRICPG